MQRNLRYAFRGTLPGSLTLPTSVVIVPSPLSDSAFCRSSLPTSGFSTVFAAISDAVNVLGDVLHSRSSIKRRG